MDTIDFKVPTSKEEMEELRKSLRQELSDDDLDLVAGGNDDKPKNKKKNKEGTPWNCPFCGATIMIYQFEDGPKHVVKCPNNPYK